MIGAHLKEVRKSLHFSQEQMTEGILDRSFYSRVENDCSEINVNDLVKLLHYHRILVADFLRGFGTTSTDIEILQNRITTAYLNEDVVTLQDLYINTKFADVRMKKVVRILINRLNGVNNLDERDREFSYSFLNEDNWNSENLWLVLHMLDLYELSDLKILVETIFHKIIRKKQMNDLCNWRHRSLLSIWRFAASVKLKTVKLRMQLLFCKNCLKQLILQFIG